MLVSANDEEIAGWVVDRDGLRVAAVCESYDIWMGASIDLYDILEKMGRHPILNRHRHDREVMVGASRVVPIVDTGNAQRQLQGTRWGAIWVVGNPAGWLIQAARSRLELPCRDIPL